MSFSKATAPPPPSTNGDETRDGKPMAPPLPTPPKMRVVTKGWWVWREEEATVEELKRADRERK
jgi:hypothetical protein